MYSNQYDFNNYQYPMEYQDDRFIFTPFLVRGLAGTALGLGIANNNQINNPPYITYPNYQFVPVYQPVPYCANCPNQPNYSTSNNYYY